MIVQIEGTAHSYFPQAKTPPFISSLTKGELINVKVIIKTLSVNVSYYITSFSIK